MANELGFSYTTGKTIYAVVRSSVNQYYVGATPEAFVSGHWSTYAVALTELAAGTGEYAASFPAVGAGIYGVTYFLQAGGTPAFTDARLGSASMSWSGTIQSFTASDSSGRATLAVAGLDAVTVEGANARQALALILDACMGVLSGAAGTSIVIKDPTGTTTRIAATVDASGNRSAITLTPPA